MVEEACHESCPIDGQPEETVINKSTPGGGETAQRINSSTSISDEEVHRKLEEGDSDKIDAALEDQGVTKTSSGEDQTAKPDTEGSNSSSKNLDEESEQG
jgi:hypothetical protein